MDIVLIVLLAVDVLLTLGVIISLATKKNVKKCEVVKEKEVDVVQPIAETKVVEETVEVVNEPVQNNETVVEEVAEVEVAAAQEEDKDSFFDSLSSTRNPAVPFYTKVLDAEEKIQTIYNNLRNEFKSFKGINARISKKCDSFRKGRELVAKIMLSGKTLKLYIKLNPNDYDVNKYHQKDVSDKKSYVETPMCVKVKSDRAYKNAVSLIQELMVKENVSKKSKFTEVNYIETLKGLEQNK